MGWGRATRRVHQRTHTTPPTLPTGVALTPPQLPHSSRRLTRPFPPTPAQVTPIDDPDLVFHLQGCGDDSPQPMFVRKLGGRKGRRGGGRGGCRARCAGVGGQWRWSRGEEGGGRWAASVSTADRPALITTTSQRRRQTASRRPLSPRRRPKVRGRHFHRQREVGRGAGRGGTGFGGWWGTRGWE